MIITHDCTSVTITSNLIDTFVASPEDYTFSVEFLYNNAAKPSRDIAVEDVNVDTLELQSQDFGLSEWSTGVYGVKLVLTPTQGSEQYEQKCFFSDCSDLICRVHKYQIDNPDSKVRNLYDALIDLENCGDCDCTYMYKAYILLLDMLNTPVTENDCKC